jgi:hypothetical protein
MTVKGPWPIPRLVRRIAAIEHALERRPLDRASRQGAALGVDASWALGRAITSGAKCTRVALHANVQAMARSCLSQARSRR